MRKISPGDKTTLRSKPLKYMGIRSWLLLVFAGLHILNLIITGLASDIAHITLTTKELWGFVALITVASLFIMITGSSLIHLLTLSLRELTKMAIEMTRGNYKFWVNVSTRDEIGILTGLMNYIAFKNNTIQHQIADRIQERFLSIDVSIEIGQRLSTFLTIDQLANEVVNQLQQAFKYYLVEVFLFEPKEQQLLLVGSTGIMRQQKITQGYKIDLTQGSVGRSARNGTYVLIKDTRIEDNWLPDPDLPGTRSEIAVPIQLGDQILGVLSVKDNTANQFETQDADLLTLIAGQIAPSLHNACILEKLQQKAELQIIHSKIMERIRNTNDENQALLVAARELSRLTGSSQT
jgi:putative methionine-R-sulfoxide reductase with GAF domain